MWEHFAALPLNRERQEVPIKIMDMNANKIPPNVKKWTKVITIVGISFFGFNYLNRHGISPVWTAVLIVLFPGFFRFIYKIICFLVAVLILIAILGFLIF